MVPILFPVATNMSGSHRSMNQFDPEVLLQIQDHIHIMLFDMYRVHLYDMIIHLYGTILYILPILLKQSITPSL